MLVSNTHCLIPFTKSPLKPYQQCFIQMRKCLNGNGSRDTQFYIV